MTRKDRFAEFVKYSLEHNPDAETELEYYDPYELIVAVILSAQCTDKRVNMVTPALYKAYPNAEALAKAEPEDIFPFIRSVSYPNNKSKHLVNMARMLIKDFNGTVPEKVEDLVKLPGVGRKTANVVASVIYDQPAMAVDTHVFRVSARLGLTVGAKTPLASEKQLVAGIPEQYISRAHHWLILHGRYVCRARRPECERCGMTYFCKYFESTFIKSKSSMGNK